jgi:hypothetical protein
MGGDSNSTAPVSSIRGQGAVGEGTCGFAECSVTALVRRCPRFAIRLRLSADHATATHSQLRSRRVTDASRLASGAAVGAAHGRNVGGAVDPDPQRTQLSPGDQCVSKLLCSAVPKATAA